MEARACQAAAEDLRLGDGPVSSLLKLRSFNRLDREDAAGPPSHSERLLSPSALQKERVAMGLSERAIRCGARSLNLVA